jgi:hypothetical protein
LTVEAIVRFWREASEAATRVPQPIKWVVFMRPEVYSQLLPMRRRKLQPYIRSVWGKRWSEGKL